MDSVSDSGTSISLPPFIYVMKIAIYFKKFENRYGARFLSVCNAQHCVGAIRVMTIINNIKDLVETDNMLTWKYLLGTVLNHKGK